MTIYMKHKTRKRIFAHHHEQELAIIPEKENHIPRVFLKHTDEKFRRECSLYLLVKNAMYSMLSNGGSRKNVHTIRVLKNLLHSSTNIMIQSGDDLLRFIQWMINEAGIAVKNEDADQANLLDTASAFTQKYDSFKDVFSARYIPGIPVDEKLFDDIQNLKEALSLFAKGFFTYKLSNLQY